MKKTKCTMCGEEINEEEGLKYVCGKPVCKGCYDEVDASL